MRSSEWQPMSTAPLNPYGQAYGPVVLIWCSADGNPWPAYYSPWHGWEHRDCGPAWVIPDQEPPIAPEDAVAWMPIAAPWSEATVKKSLTTAEPVMPAEIWCTPKKTWHFTDGYGTRYVRGDMAFRQWKNTNAEFNALDQHCKDLEGIIRDLIGTTGVPWAEAVKRGEAALQAVDEGEQ